MMLKKILLILMFLSAARAENFQATESEKLAFKLTFNFLHKYHYSHKDIYKYSKEIHDKFINNLDESHIYFTQSDIDDLRQYENVIGEYKGNELIAPFKIHSVFKERARELAQFSIERLKKPLNIDTNETISFPELKKKVKLPYFLNKNELFQYQEKRLTDQLIRLMLVGNDEKKARTLLTKRYESILSNLNKVKQEDIFSAYVNTITNFFDPHTNYLLPVSYRDYDINMKLELEGIGATLTQQDEKIIIRDLIVGAPAQLSGQIKLKDAILAVGQGENGEMVDVTGWRIDDAVLLIRGKKNTKVKLRIESDGVIKEIVLIRDKVKLEKQAASYTIENIGNKKIAIIDLPSFYIDFLGAKNKQKDYRSTSRDLSTILKKINKEKVDGLLIDLRSNAGGSLDEAIKSAGLFIDKGAIVLTYDKSEISIMEDPIKGVEYKGKLAVLIDEYSASASEIFASAIQDYQRGLVIGNTSFGKGTVQSLVDLDRFMKSESPLGNIKFTISTYHRVTGDSVQLHGVDPDISLPDISEENDTERGERAYEHPIAAQKIKGAVITKTNDVTPLIIQKLKTLHEQRLQSDVALKNYLEHLDYLSGLNKRKEFSLNFNVRQKEYNERKSKQKDYETAQRALVPLLKHDERTLKDIEESNLFLDEKTAEEKRDFVPDLNLYEALNIVRDFIEIKE